MDFICPSCKSDNIQRLSIIYEGGLSDINTTSKGTAIGLGRGGMGVGVGASKTKGTSQTAASKRAAPPAKKGYWKPLIPISVAAVVVMIVTGGSDVGARIANIGWMAACIGWTIHAKKYNTETWPPLKAAWDNSYLCNRCNEMFCLGGS